MKTRDLHKQIAGLILGFVILSGVGLGSTMTGRAQDRNNNGDQNRRDWDRYGNYGGSAELRQTALNAGYNEGLREGSNDRQSGRRSSYQNSSTYQNATKDYSRHLGDRELYRRYFREAFQNGYNADTINQNGQGRDDRDRNPNGTRTRHGRNWDGYGNIGGSPELRQTALNAGYNEGNRQGRSDRNKRYSPGFQNQSAYQKATKDYSSRLGDRSIYQRYFREAYENGYSDGVNGY
jgi:hypothetical protein